MPELVAAFGVERVRPREPGAVDQGVDRAELSHDGGDPVSYRLRVGDVAGEPEVRGAVGEAFERTRAGCDAPAGRLEPLDDGAADAARPPGDEHRPHSGGEPPPAGAA